jgi:hypothetical protein
LSLLGTGIIAVALWRHWRARKGSSATLSLF